MLPLSRPIHRLVRRRCRYNFTSFFDCLVSLQWRGFLRCCCVLCSWLLRPPTPPAHSHQALLQGQAAAGGPTLRRRRVLWRQVRRHRRARHRQGHQAGPPQGPAVFFLEIPGSRPEDFVFSWGLLLYEMSRIDENGLKQSQSLAEQIKRQLEKRQFVEAKASWQELEEAIARSTNNVNFYNFLEEEASESAVATTTQQ